MAGAAKATALTIERKLADPDLWYQDGREVSLGCVGCPEEEWCGGLSTEAGLFNCMELCCGKPDVCEQYACPRQDRYSALVNEVGGFDLAPYRQPVAQPPALPSYVPFMQDWYVLRGPIAAQAVAVSLFDLLDTKTGLAKFGSKREVLERFKISPTAKLVITSTDKDRLVENAWWAMRPKDTAESIRKLHPAIVTTPNFSMHINAPRHDNLVSMARIAACFEEFAAAGLPVALHVNARTPTDFARWTEYLVASNGIGLISYEMGTIGGSNKRRAWHAARLVELARDVPRPLTLLIRGGSVHLGELGEAFDRVIVSDTNPHMKAKKRQRASMLDGRVVWSPSPTAPGETIDALLLRNMAVCSCYVRSLLPASRAVTVS
jgi:hypothetical protein